MSLLNSPASGNSPSSADSPNAPLTPASPVQTLTLPPPAEQSSNQSATSSNNASNANSKRKPSRRANTAERRATHNAVERQRRETLNSRFLDLAALLPNLSQIRRPSKSAIVNSSIAHIHASRRHRLLASREVRLLKLESDALRRELNEWRDRANLPRVEEPVRSEAFAMVLSGEVEVLTSIPGMEDEEDGGDDYGDEGQDIAVPNMNSMPIIDDIDLYPSNKGGNPYGHNVPSSQFSNILPRPMVAQGLSGVNFENPAMGPLFDSPQQGFNNIGFNGLGGNGPDMDKVANWNSQLFAAQQMQQQQQQQYGNNMFSPPASSHGSAPNSAAQFGNGAYFANMQRQQMQGNGHLYGSPVDNEDASSVGSSGHGHNIGPINIGGGARGRSASMSTGSGYGSPPLHRSNSSGSGSYELDAFGGKRMSQGAMWRESPISVGGGGNANGFAMMM